MREYADPFVPPFPEKTVIVALFRVKSDEGDYLLCRHYDAFRDQEGEEDVRVAKPPLQRRYDQTSRTIAGTTYNYTYSDNRSRTSTNSGDAGDTADYTIEPEYQVDDLIWGMRNIQGGTGATDWEGDAAADANPVLWQDVNVEGRCWAEN